MAEIFPEDKTQIKIETSGLPDLDGSLDAKFEFEIWLKNDGFEVLIPGTPRGYDLVIPSSKEQESWMRKFDRRYNDMREIWYCAWQIKKEKTLQRFLKHIEPYIIKKEYS